MSHVALLIELSSDAGLSAVQFAGSLGKLTVSSVNNPRKMIDAVVTTRSDDEVFISFYMQTFLCRRCFSCTLFGKFAL